MSACLHVCVLSTPPQQELEALQIYVYTYTHTHVVHVFHARCMVDSIRVLSQALGDRLPVPKGSRSVRFQAVPLAINSRSRQAAALRGQWWDHILGGCRCRQSLLLPAIAAIKR